MSLAKYTIGHCEPCYYKYLLPRRLSLEAIVHHDISLTSNNYSSKLFFVVKNCGLRSRCVNFFCVELSRQQSHRDSCVIAAFASLLQAGKHALRALLKLGMQVVHIVQSQVRSCLHFGSIPL